MGNSLRIVRVLQGVLLVLFINMSYAQNFNYFELTELENYGFNYEWMSEESFILKWGSDELYIKLGSNVAVFNGEVVELPAIVKREKDAVIVPKVIVYRYFKKAFSNSTVNETEGVKRQDFPAAPTYEIVETDSSTLEIKVSGLDMVTTKELILEEKNVAFVVVDNGIFLWVKELAKKTGVKYCFKGDVRKAVEFYTKVGVSKVFVFRQGECGIYFDEVVDRNGVPLYGASLADYNLVYVFVDPSDECAIDLKEGIEKIVQEVK